MMQKCGGETAGLDDTRQAKLSTDPAGTGPGADTSGGAGGLKMETQHDASAAVIQTTGQENSALNGLGEDDNVQSAALNVGTFGYFL